MCQVRPRRASQVFAVNESNSCAGAIAMRMFGARSFERQAMYFEIHSEYRVPDSITESVLTFVMRGTQCTCATLTKFFSVSHFGPNSSALPRTRTKISCAGIEQARRYGIRVVWRAMHLRGADEIFRNMSFKG